MQTVIQYKNLIQHIAAIIDVSGYRHDYIARKLDLRPQNFSVKKQRATWTPDEVEKLLTIIENEDVEDYLLLQEMRGLENDETVTLDEFKKLWK